VARQTRRAAKQAGRGPNPKAPSPVTAAERRYANFFDLDRVGDGRGLKRFEPPTLPLSVQCPRCGREQLLDAVALGLRRPGSNTDESFGFERTPRQRLSAGEITEAEYRQLIHTRYLEGLMDESPNGG